jgi:hypothetical protein
MSETVDDFHQFILYSLTVQYSSTYPHQEKKDATRDAQDGVGVSPGVDVSDDVYQTVHDPKLGVRLLV